MLKYFLALIALVPFSALAQPSDTDDLPRWYQIELLIFQQNDIDTEEIFRDLPFELEQNSILSQAPLLNSLLNKQPNGARKVEPPTPDEEATDTEIEALASTETDEFSGLDAEPTPSNGIGDSNLDEISEAIAEPEIPTFIAASDAELRLAEHEEKLRRRRAYRVLWHGAWQQALEENTEKNYLISAGRLVLQPSAEDAKVNTEADTDTAEPLDMLIDSLVSGNTVDAVEENLNVSIEEAVLSEEQRLAEAVAIVETAPATFRELQGSIKLRKTRFAHLDIDLWFTQLDPSIPPLNVPQLTVHEIEIPEINTTEQPEEEIPTVTAQDFLDDVDADLLTDQTEALVPPLPRYTMNYEAAYEPLLYGHIEENRRLRSKELYYVDHPMFGMVIKMVEVPHPLLRVDLEATSKQSDPLAF